MRWRTLGLILLLLGLLNPPPAHALESPACSWAGENNQREVNIGAPDSDELDWLSPLTASSQTEEVISGEYPAARYFSFHLYNETGEAIDSIYDQEIDPDPGSANPFRAKPRRGAGDSYHVTISFAPKPADPPPNTIYAGEPSEAPLALLVYRVYVPTDANEPTGGVPYPRLTLATTGGVSISGSLLPECPLLLDRDIRKGWLAGVRACVILEPR
jgi:hypothetical protein